MKRGQQPHAEPVYVEMFRTAGNRCTGAKDDALQSTWQKLSARTRAVPSKLVEPVGVSDSWTTGTEQLDRLTRWRPQEPVSLWHGSVSGRKGISAGGAWLALCTKGAGATFRATEEGEHPLTSRPVARWI